MRSAIDLAREKHLITEWKGVEDWRDRQQVLRSYDEEVVSRINKIAASGQFTLEQYGELSHDPERYPLFALKSKLWNPANDNILLTGGVHGYETSGVQGTLDFLEKYAHHYKDHFNFVAAPDVSPWGYETNNRWNYHAMDVNREFYDGSKCEESTLLMRYLKSLSTPFRLHGDHHETTDTDASVYRIEKDLKNNTPHSVEIIPNGFYLVVPDNRVNKPLAKAIITSVGGVTDIAPAENGILIGKPEIGHGTIKYPSNLGLCQNITDGDSYTSECYPDGDNTTPEECNLGQVACIIGGANHILEQKGIEPPKFDLAA